MGKDKRMNAELIVSVTFRHTEATESIKKYASEKITQRIKKYIKGTSNAHIILSVEKLEHFAEVHVTARNIDMVAKVSTGDLYSSIDKLVDTLEAQLRKHKDKQVRGRHLIPQFAPA